jgi:ubiquinone/menaquinone biosynthesis C-methylase UbiE
VTSASDWVGKVGATWATEWQRTDRSFAPVNARLVARATQLLSGIERPHVLDIGCGAGTTSLTLAHALPAARITGIDISPDLIAAARERVTNHSRIDFMLGDANTSQPPGALFDMMVSRHGIMFFEEPVSAFRHLHTLVKPGGAILFSCFRTVAENIWAAEMAPLLKRTLDMTLPETVPHAPGPFGFADEIYVQNILRQSGFTNGTAEKFDFGYVAGHGPDPVADAVDFFSRIGPFARLLKEVPAGAKPKLMNALAAFAALYRHDDAIKFPAAAWIWSATAS